MSDTQRLDRLYNLDVLRGVAIFLVLWRHVPVRADLSRGGAELVVDALHRLGWCGVDLFFVLSGFLISGLLFKEFDRDGRLNLGRFWLRRGLKIWPSYLCAYGLLTLLGGVQAACAGDGTALRSILQRIVPNLIFVQNYLPSSLRWPNSWSLAVEEHFYLGLPLLLIGLATWGRSRGLNQPGEWFRHLPALGLGLGVTALAFRLVMWYRGDWMGLYYPTHARADSLFFGVVLGYARHYRADLFARLARCWPVLLLAVPLALVIPWFYPVPHHALSYTVGFTTLYLGFGALVVLAGAYPGFGREAPRGLALPLRGLAWLGVYSYTVYLAHSVIYRLPGATELRHALTSLVGGASPLAAAWADRLAFLALSIAGGIALSHLVERPCLRWRERWLGTTSARGREPNAPTRWPSHPAAAPPLPALRAG